MGDIIDILHQQYAYNRLSEDAVSKNIQKKNCNINK